VLAKRADDRRFRRVSALIALAGLVGCDGTVASDTDVGPLGDPALAFAVPAAAGEAPCLSLGASNDAELTLVMTPTELEVRPPGACGSSAQCGRLSLYVEGALNNESGVPAIALLARKLADPIHDGRPRLDDGEPDLLSLRVEVTTELDEPLLDEEGLPVEATLDVVTVPDCDAR